jgi:hypothetical protein
MATWSWSPLKLVASIPLSWDSTLLVCFSCRRYVALQIQMYLFIYSSLELIDQRVKEEINPFAM